MSNGYSFVLAPLIGLPNSGYGAGSIAVAAYTNIPPCPNIETEPGNVPASYVYSNDSLSWKFSVTAGTFNIYAQIQGTSGEESNDAFAWADMTATFSDS
ncbi:MAG: hypothetical protein WBY94_13255 [Polyangiaceae bacterium]